jgi:8-oxo-dGTP pyrophosphatase MutT (NUDIX family)
VRELLEEVGLRVEPVEALAAFEHAYPARTVRLYPFFCRDQDPSHPPAKLLGVAEARWIAPTDLPTYRFLPANGPLIAAVMAAWAGQAARR